MSALEFKIPVLQVGQTWTSDHPDNVHWDWLKIIDIDLPSTRVTIEILLNDKAPRGGLEFYTDSVGNVLNSISERGWKLVN